MDKLAQLSSREKHLIRKALAIAVLAIERQPGPLQSISDQHDMKGLLDHLVEDDTQLEFYARAGWIAVTGEPSKPR